NPQKKENTMRYAKLVFALFGFAATLVAADPSAGAWELNPAKSKYSPGPAPPSATTTYEENARGLKHTGANHLPDGTKTRFEYTAKYDGKDHPVTGTDRYDAVALKRINDRTVDSTLKKSGKVITTSRRVVSKDGKTMTLTISGTNAKGENMKNVAVFEKQ